MPRFCDYCHSYLTHDTPSVRKSHLLGKNHLRLAADYYCNKARQTQQPIFGKVRNTKKHRNRAQKRKTEPPQPSLALHCDTNRQKRSVRRMRSARPDTDRSRITVLEKLYRESPAYAKVFISECRLDTGQSVRLERLPQRANKKPQRPNGTGIVTNTPHVTRNALFKRDYSNAGADIADASTVRSLLPPPPSLAQWPGCPPLQYASGRAAHVTLQHVTRKLEARKLEGRV